MWFHVLNIPFQFNWTIRMIMLDPSILYSPPSRSLLCFLKLTYNRLLVSPNSSPSLTNTQRFINPPINIFWPHSRKSGWTQRNSVLLCHLTAQTWLCYVRILTHDWETRHFDRDAERHRIPLFPQKFNFQTHLSNFLHCGEMGDQRRVGWGGRGRLKHGLKINFFAFLLK